MLEKFENLQKQNDKLTMQNKDLINKLEHLSPDMPASCDNRKSEPRGCLDEYSACSILEPFTDELNGFANHIMEAYDIESYPKVIAMLRELMAQRLESLLRDAQTKADEVDCNIGKIKHFIDATQKA